MVLVFKQIFKSLLNMIYIRKCVICSNNSENYLCEKCNKKINKLSASPHKIYKNIPVYSAYLYQDTIKKLIRNLKFNHKKTCAIPLADLLFDYFKTLELNEEYTIIYPPIFYLKQFERGYNPMELVAFEFSNKTNLKVEKNLIKKTKYTKPQYKVKNRKENVKGSFEINKNLAEKYKNKKLLILDDIITSGGTMEEIINILLDLKIKDLTCITISKAGCFS